MNKHVNNKNAQNFVLSCCTPVILVTRGCLAPYFLNWWRAMPNPLYIMDFSRWRWFEFGKNAAPRWIGTEPPKGEVVLFDRNTTTGQTLRLLKMWLIERGYTVTVMGHLDRNMCRFGIQYVDVIWDDHAGYNAFGLACEHDGDSGVKLVKYGTSNTEQQYGGAYTFCVIGGTRAELGGIMAPLDINVRMESTDVAKTTSVVYQNVQSWEHAMMLGYVNSKPLITVAGAPGVVADYAHNGDVSEISTYLQQEADGVVP